MIGRLKFWNIFWVLVAFVTFEFWFIVIGVLRFALTLDLILLQVLGDEEKRERYDRGEDLEEQHGGGQGFHQGFHGGGQTFSFQFEGGFPGGGFHF